MATDHFLDLTAGDINGESSDEKFSKHVELDSWHVHVSNPPDITSAKGGAGTGRVTCGPLHFTAKQSAATLGLFEKCCIGKHMPTVTLHCRKAGGDQQVFHTITMEEVYVGHHALSGVQGSDNNADEWHLHYGSIKHEYFTQGKDGTVTSAGSKKWDLRTNTAS